MKKAILGLFLVFITLLVIGCGNLTDEGTQETKYTVFYVGNGNTSGYVPSDNNQYLSGADVIVLDKGSLAKNGYVFSNWNTNQQGTGISYNPGDKIRIESSNITIYAIWTELPKYTVSFETYGGSSIQSITNVTSGTKITKPTNPTKANSAFEGWFIDEEFETEWNFQNDTVEKNLTLYAKWRNTLYPYEVTNVSGYKISTTVVLSWTNPIDVNFDHVRIILEGFEWVESMGGTDQEPGKTSYSANDFSGATFVIIKCVGKDGTVSEGIKYNF